MIIRDKRLLAEAMRYRRLTVRGLASQIGVDRSTIGHLRSGARRTVKPEIATRIAEALQMPEDFFFVPRPANVARAVDRRAA